MERHGDAETILKRSHEIFQEQGGPDAWRAREVRQQLIDLYERQGKRDSAEGYRQTDDSPLVERALELPYSALFQDRSVWAFGGGTWSWTGDLEGRDGIATFQRSLDDTGTPRLLLPFTEEEKTFNEAHLGDDCLVDCGLHWVLKPGPVVVDPGTGQALIFYQKVLAEWDFDLRGAGRSIALWQSPDEAPQRPHMRPDRMDPTVLFPPEEPALGAAALVVGDQLYAYACKVMGLDNPCIIARASLADASERQAWRYYAGDEGWSADWQDAEIVLDGASPLSVHWNEYLGKYVAVYAEPLAHTISIRLADRPEGPWSDVLASIECEWSSDGGSIRSGLAHREFARVNGRVEYITYWRATGYLSGELRLIEVVFR